MVLFYTGPAIFSTCMLLFFVFALFLVSTDTFKFHCTSYLHATNKVIKSCVTEENYLEKCSLNKKKQIFVLNFKWSVSTASVYDI